MRSGVIAQKVGMTRIFTEAGEHIPVTVLRLEKCQVLGHRTEEKNGYVAPPARRRHAQADAADQARARELRQDRGRAQAQARRVPRLPGQPHRGGRGDHRRPLRARPVRRRDRHQPGQGVPGRHEALELRRPARHARRLGRAPQPRLDRPAPGPRQGVQGQEDGRPHGRRARHHAEPRRSCAPTWTAACSWCAARCRARRAAGCSCATPSSGRCRRRRPSPARSRASAAAGQAKKDEA